MRSVALFDTVGFLVGNPNEWKLGRVERIVSKSGSRSVDCHQPVDLDGDAQHVTVLVRQFLPTSNSPAPARSAVLRSGPKAHLGPAQPADPDPVDDAANSHMQPAPAPAAQPAAAQSDVPAPLMVRVFNLDLESPVRKIELSAVISSVSLFFDTPSREYELDPADATLLDQHVDSMNAKEARRRSQAEQRSGAHEIAQAQQAMSADGSVFVSAGVSSRGRQRRTRVELQ